MLNFSRRLFKFLASLKLAVILLLMLATILAAATYYESVYDTPTAQHLVYRSKYFAVFLGLLFCNVFCSTMSRYPWKRYQLGFVVTHIGILTLLIGSLVTMVTGVEGSVSIEEGATSSRLLIDEPVFMVGATGTSLREIGAEFRWRQPTSEHPARLDLGEGLTARVDRYLHHAKQNIFYVEDASSGVAAAKIRLKNSRVNLAEWLTAGKGDLALGPATVLMRRLTSPHEVEQFLSKVWQPRDRGELQLLVSGRPYRIGVAELLDKGDVPVEDTGYTVHVTQYLAHALPVNGVLVSKSDKPVNPMIEVELKDGKGDSQIWLLFARLPELNTRRKSVGKEMGIGMMYSFEAPSGKHRLVVGLDSQGKVYSKVDEKPGQAVTVGTAYPTGWMDIQFTVEESLEHAKQVRDYTEVSVEKGEEGPSSAVLVSVEGCTRPEAFWMERGDVVQLNRPDGTPVVFGYSYRSMDMGFPIKLKEFHIDHDPGTTTAAAYRSVVVVDNKEHTIQMNEPLEMNGFKFFQASFGETQGGEAKVSVLTAAKDPGLMLKLVGSLLLVSGIVIMFYIRPYQIKNRRQPDQPVVRRSSAAGAAAQESGGVAQDSEQSKEIL